MASLHHISMYTTIHFALPYVDIGNLKKKQFLCSPGLFSNIVVDDKKPSSVLGFHNINPEHLLILGTDFSYVKDFSSPKTNGLLSAVRLLTFFLFL